MDAWLKKKRDTDHAEGLWRIGDKIYDLSRWAEKHPGGSHWIENTKDTDITELFETHHISPQPATILSNFEVRDAKTARSYPYTFYPDGFYNTLKRRIHAKLTTLPRKNVILSKSLIITDCLVTVSLILSVLAAKYVSLLIATCAAVTLALATISSHNFTHSRDNWRMYYFCLSSLSIKKWRTIHIVSHHMYTNSAEDLEITLFKPFFEWFPTLDKVWFAKHLAPFYAPVIYLFTTVKEVLERILTQNNQPSDLLVFITPALMYLFNSESILTVIAIWIWIIMFCSLIFVFVGVTAAHHHPDIYHEGDVRRKDQDWGLYQLDASRDRIETKQNTFLSLITFGDHGLHHLFPTIDQALLPYLYSELEITCQEFGIERKDLTAWELIRGQFQQLSRTKPNLKKLD